MILLDTNIVSELIGSHPSNSVERWVDAHSPARLFTSATTIAEILYGLRIMPDGRRRQTLSTRFEGFAREIFGPRILSFDEAAARAYGEIRGRRKELGRPMSDFDGQIAAIARVNGLALATRNVRDFADIGLDLINPFEYVG